MRLLNAHRSGNSVKVAPLNGLKLAFGHRKVYNSAIMLMFLFLQCLYLFILADGNRWARGSWKCIVYRWVRSFSMARALV